MFVAYFRFSSTFSITKLRSIGKQYSIMEDILLIIFTGLLLLGVLLLIVRGVHCCALQDIPIPLLLCNANVSGVNE
jgi:hypothetical protein